MQTFPTNPLIGKTRGKRGCEPETRAPPSWWTEKDLPTTVVEPRIEDIHCSTAGWTDGRPFDTEFVAAARNEKPETTGLQNWHRRE